MSHVDDRAVSRVLGYSLVLTISTVLVAGLVMAGTSFVTDQRSHVVDSELEVIGQRLAADISTADRLVRAGENATTIRIDSQVPPSVAGANYNVEVITSDGNASLRIDTPTLERSVTTPLVNTTAIATGNVSGGDILVAYDADEEHVEVTNDS